MKRRPVRALPPNQQNENDISDEERDDLHDELERFEASYWSEFEKHGVRNILIVRGTGPLS